VLRRKLGDLLAAVAVIDREQRRIRPVGQAQGDRMRIFLQGKLSVFLHLPLYNLQKGHRLTAVLSQE
jgi:hypothetical protein